MTKTQSPPLEEAEVEVEDKDRKRKAQDAGGCGRTSTIVYFCGEERKDRVSWYRLILDGGDVECRTPEPLEPFAFRRDLSNPETAVVDGRIYSISGFESGSQNSYSEKVYSFGDGAWKDCSSLKQISRVNDEQYGHQAIAVNDKVYVFGSKIDLNYYNLQQAERDEIENNWAQVYDTATNEWSPLKLKYYEDEEDEGDESPKSLLGIIFDEFINDGFVTEIHGVSVRYKLGCFPITVDAFGDNKIRIHTHDGCDFILDVSANTSEKNSLKKVKYVAGSRDFYEINPDGYFLVYDGLTVYRSKDPFYHKLSDTFKDWKILRIAHTGNGFPEQPQLHLLWRSPHPDNKQQLFYGCIEYEKMEETFKLPDSNWWYNLLKVNVKCSKSYLISTTVFPIHGVVLPAVENVYVWWINLSH